MVIFRCIWHRKLQFILSAASITEIAEILVHGHCSFIPIYSWLQLSGLRLVENCCVVLIRDGMHITEDVMKYVDSTGEHEISVIITRVPY